MVRVVYFNTLAKSRVERSYSLKVHTCVASAHLCTVAGPRGLLSHSVQSLFVAKKAWSMQTVDCTLQSQDLSTPNIEYILAQQRVCCEILEAALPCPFYIVWSTDSHHLTTLLSMSITSDFGLQCLFNCLVDCSSRPAPTSATITDHRL